MTSRTASVIFTLLLVSLFQNHLDSLYTNGIFIVLGFRPLSLSSFSRSVLAKTEAARTNRIIEKAVHQFTEALNFHLSEGIDIEADDFLEQIEKEEQQLLEAFFDEEEYEDTDEESEEENEEVFEQGHETAFNDEWDDDTFFSEGD